MFIRSQTFVVAGVGADVSPLFPACSSGGIRERLGRSGDADEEGLSPL